MVQTVTIRKGEKIIYIHFSYNTDLIDIMREYKGWWFRKEKAWQFPLFKYDDLYNKLKEEKYNVRILKLEEKKLKEKPKLEQTSIDPWKNKTVVSVPGHCKECKQWHFLSKDGLCLQCRIKLEK